MKIYGGDKMIQEKKRTIIITLTKTQGKELYADWKKHIKRWKMNCQDVDCELNRFFWSIKSLTYTKRK